MTDKKIEEEVQAFAAEYWQQEGGDNWAEHISQVEEVLEIFNPILVNKAEPTAGEQVLDIGCGGGLTSLAMAQQLNSEGSVTGVDISPQILAIAEKRTPAKKNITFSLADVASTDLGKLRYDLITSRFGIMFFSEPVAAFTHVHAAMKTDGRFVAMVWQAMEKNLWMFEPAKAVAKVLPAVEKQEEDDEYAPGPFALADPALINEIFNAAGFSQVELTDIKMGMNMGSIDNAVQFLLDIGPAAAQLRDASAEQLDKAKHAIATLLESYRQAELIIMPAAVWIIQAKH